MRLQKIDISNYRSIESVSITFEPRCRVLVGRNEVGKTNILSACALIDPASTISPADLRETKDGENPVESGHVRFIFDLAIEETNLFKKNIGSIVLGGDKPLFSHRGRHFSAEKFADDYRQWLYIVTIPSGGRYQTHWAKGAYKLAPGWLTPKPGLDPSTLMRSPNGKILLLGKAVLVHEKFVDPGGKDNFVAADAANVLAIYRDQLRQVVEEKIPGCLNWRYAEANLLPPSIDIEGFKTNPLSCEPLRAMFLLAGYPDPSAALTAAQLRVGGLKNLLGRVARKATEHVKERWRELGSIELVLTPNGSQIDAAVRDSFNDYTFNQRSEGFKRFISFLLLVSARSAAKDFSEILFIQDEPDLGLHPTGIKSLLAEIIELSESNYVLVSSHSIFMVDKEKIERHLIVVKNDEATSVLDVDRSRINDEEVLMNALGYSLFDLVKPTNLIFEGWRDKKLFKVSLSRRNDVTKYLNARLSTDLGIVHAVGVNDIPKVATYFDAIDRSSFAISDSDQVAVQRQRASIDRPELRWKRYDELLGLEEVLTAEDFIKPAVLRSTLTAWLAQKSLKADLTGEHFNHPVAGGVMASVSAILLALGVDQATQKDFLNGWKASIFDHLKADDIDARYADVVKAISVELGYEDARV